MIKLKDMIRTSTDNVSEDDAGVWGRPEDQDLCRNPI